MFSILLLGIKKCYLYNFSSNNLYILISVYIYLALAVKESTTLIATPGHNHHVTQTSMFKLQCLVIEVIDLRC